MLEWKARILTLMVSLGTIWDQLSAYNWNW
jgi:hypothetical protein